MAESKKKSVRKRNVQRSATAKTAVLKQGKFPKEITAAKKKEQTLTMRPETRKAKGGKVVGAKAKAAPAASRPAKTAKKKKA